MNKDIATQIQIILDDNKINDLKKFLDKRQCLNKTNNILIYLFHLIQSIGILTTSFAAGSNNINLVWLGITLNIFASLINVYEKTNDTILKKLMNDIKLIRTGNYIEEGELIDVDTKNNNTFNNETNTSNPSLTTLPNPSSNSNS